MLYRIRSMIKVSGIIGFISMNENRISQPSSTRRLLTHLASGSIAFCEIASLDHKIFDDPVERRSLVVQWHSGRSVAPLAGAKRPEVLRGFGGNVRVQLHHDSAERLITMPKVEEHVRIVAPGIWQ